MKLLVGIFKKYQKDKPSPKTMSENISFWMLVLLNQSTASSTECNVATNCKSVKLLNNFKFSCCWFSSSMIIVLIIFKKFEMVRFCLKWFDVLLPVKIFLKSYNFEENFATPRLLRLSRNKWDFFYWFYFSIIFDFFSSQFFPRKS